jgi:hypothetical protein
MGWEISSEVGRRLRTRFDDLTPTFGSADLRVVHLDKAPRGTRRVLRPRDAVSPGRGLTGSEPAVAPVLVGRQGFVSARPRALTSTIHKHTRNTHEKHTHTESHEASCRRGRGCGQAGPSRWRVPVCGRGHDGTGGAATQDIRRMGAWWMPWRWRPRKDAATRRNAPGRRWQPAIRGCPNGATRPAHGRAPEVTQEGTGGTETSQYPEEQRGFP